MDERPQSLRRPDVRPFGMRRAIVAIGATFYSILFYSIGATCTLGVLCGIVAVLDSFFPASCKERISTVGTHLLFAMKREGVKDTA